MFPWSWSKAGVVEVKASHGDTRVGGDDFDQLLVEHAVAAFKQHNLDLHQDLKTLRRLKVAMERAKCRLSDEPWSRARGISRRRAPLRI